MKKTSFILILLATGTLAMAENIDPYDAGEQFAYGENVGWLNFEPAMAGIHVYADRVEGFVWGQNIGWINLSPTLYGGIANDGAGNLSGFAWAENAGWINFDPAVGGDTANLYKVSIDGDGFLSGWAWGENIGWIHFDETQSSTVRVCVVTLDDLANFAADWLVYGNPPANLNGDRIVDLQDYDGFAASWKDYCPDGWQLK